MKLFLVLSSILLATAATTARAEFNGTWGGNFSETGSDGSSSVTPGFVLGITTTGNTIVFSEPMGFTFLDGVTLTVQGSSLMYNNHEVGTISANSMDITFVDDIDNEFDQIGITTDLDGTLEYTDYFADYVGDYIDSTSVALPTTSVVTKHVPRGSTLQALFKALKPKKK